LEARGQITRRQRSDGRIGNWLMGDNREAIVKSTTVAASSSNDSSLSEDAVKKFLMAWLERDGWEVAVAWGKSRGVDIEAKRAGKRWLIEVKGCGSRPEMRVNYFIGMLGELLQRMDDSQARYSIALPDMKQFRGLWARLPTLAKQRLGLSILFVAETGHITLLEE
ncbi:MAG TPA: MarR family transcriptional regulator, partial [Alphaproteobacteria bacterium]